MPRRIPAPPTADRIRAPEPSRRILFVLGAGYLPVSITGANVSLHALCRRLVADGFDPLVLCSPDPADAVHPAGARPITEYPVIRVGDPVAAMIEMIGRLAPSAVVVRGLGAAARASTMKAAVDHPLHVQILRSPLGYALPPHSATPRWRYAANSRFLATIGAAYLGCLVDLVPSLVEPRDYAGTEKGDAVLFINPIADKGVHVALAIAERLPRRKFIFVRSWPKHPDHPEPEVRLANVEWAESTLDMRPLYGRTRLLLVPSVWEESTSRAVAEAQLRGIPTVASDRGGLRESVGPGGLVLSLGEPIERWCAAVESMFADARKYATLSRCAKQHARRPEMSPRKAVASFYRFIGARRPQR